MNPKYNKFKKIIQHPVKYQLFMLLRLPMAFISGLKVEAIDEVNASVAVRFKWLNQNPFRSIYFAVLSMAAELSTGIMAFGNIYERKPSVSMLVTKMEAEFFKKAIGKIVFTCSNGNEIAKAIEESIQTNAATEVKCESMGVNEKGEIVAKFYFVWSFKAK